ASYHIAFSPDGSRFARCYLGGIKVYDTPTPAKPGSPNPVQRAIPAPAPTENAPRQIFFTCSLFGKDSKTLFTGASDGLVRLYDLDNGNLLGPYKAHTAGVTALAFPPAGIELASASLDHTVRFWPFDIVSQSREFAGHEGPVWTAVFSPDGARVVSASA